MVGCQDSSVEQGQSLQGRKISVHYKVKIFWCKYIRKKQSDPRASPVIHPIGTQETPAVSQPSMSVILCTPRSLPFPSPSEAANKPYLVTVKTPLLLESPDASREPGGRKIGNTTSGVMGKVDSRTGRLESCMICRDTTSHSLRVQGPKGAFLPAVSILHPLSSPTLLPDKLVQNCTYPAKCQWAQLQTSAPNWVPSSITETQTHHVGGFNHSQRSSSELQSCLCLS